MSTPGNPAEASPRGWWLMRGSFLCARTSGPLHRRAWRFLAGLRYDVMPLHKDEEVEALKARIEELLAEVARRDALIKSDGFEDMRRHAQDLAQQLGAARDERDDALRDEDIARALLGNTQGDLDAANADNARLREALKKSIKCDDCANEAGIYVCLGCYERRPLKAERERDDLRTQRDELAEVLRVVEVACVRQQRAAVELKIEVGLPYLGIALDAARAALAKVAKP